ncbi:glycosyltransferase family 2 protein [Robbsia sp. KACC 23696]|uniref:glycosyltransferase family 2 protein n=1 Tax=Robbsia sp. KACC 23696 TaxID=3149231 RepID=UPI00325B0B52
MDTVACVESILGMQSTSIRVIVCDNCSTDDSFVEMSKFFSRNSNISELGGYLEVDVKDCDFNGSADPFLTLVQVGENNGYAAGNNAGIKIALSKFNMRAIWILNNDTILDNRAFHELINASNRFGNEYILGSALCDLDSPNKIQMLGGRLNKMLGVPIKIGKNKDIRSYAEIFDVDYVCGASIFIPKEVILSIGVMDERYFLYWEETDYCFRFSFITGKKPKCVPTSVVFHKEGAKVGRRTFTQRNLDAINCMRFFTRFFPIYAISVFFIKPVVDIYSAAKNGELSLSWFYISWHWFFVAIRASKSTSTRKLLDKKV